MSEFGRDSWKEKMPVESLGASTLEKRYGISLNESNSWNFGLEMTIREYENSLFQIEKLEANIKDLKLEVNHLQGAKQRADNQVGENKNNRLSSLTIFESSLGKDLHSNELAWHIYFIIRLSDRTISW